MREAHKDLPDVHSTATLSHAALCALLADIFRGNGCTDEVARILADNCAGAEAAGSFSHGIFRIVGYVSTLRSGWVDGRAEPKLEDRAPAFLCVDAANGFAQPALAAARPLFVEKICSAGIALLAIRHSHHFGALWPDVETFADEGLVAISMVNSFTCAIPSGARKPLLGTNPIAFAAPIESGPPLVFDFATTTMANGDVQIAALEGRQLPPGVGVDRHGEPTCDPSAILDGGALVPFGGHKGSAISLMIELMTAGLSGGNFSFEFDWSTHPGAQTPLTGRILIGIDPGFSSTGNFATRGRRLAKELADAGMSVYPGARRRRQGVKQDVQIRSADLQRLQDYASGRR